MIRTLLHRHGYKYGISINDIGISNNINIMKRERTSSFSSSNMVNIIRGKNQHYVSSSTALSSQYFLPQLKMPLISKGWRSNHYPYYNIPFNTTTSLCTSLLSTVTSSSSTKKENNATNVYRKNFKRKKKGPSPLSIQQRELVMQRLATDLLQKTSSSNSNSSSSGNIIFGKEEGSKRSTSATTCCGDVTTIKTNSEIIITKGRRLIKYYTDLRFPNRSLPLPSFSLSPSTSLSDEGDGNDVDDVDDDEFFETSPSKSQSLSIPSRFELSGPQLCHSILVNVILPLFQQGNGENGNDIPRDDKDYDRLLAAVIDMGLCTVMALGRNVESNNGTGDGHCRNVNQRVRSNRMTYRTRNSTPPPLLPMANGDLAEGLLRQLLAILIHPLPPSSISFSQKKTNTERMQRKLNHLFNATLNVWSLIASNPLIKDGCISREAALRAEHLLLDLALSRNKENNTEHCSTTKSSLTDSNSTLLNLLSPDVVSFNTVIGAWSNAGRKSSQQDSSSGDNSTECAERAESILRLIEDVHDNHTLKDSLSTASMVKPDRRSYDVTIKAWSNSNDPTSSDRATSVLRGMMNRFYSFHDCNSNDTTCNDFLLEPQRQGLPPPPFPSVHTFTNVISALSNSSRGDAAHASNELLLQMECLGIKGYMDASPDVIAYNACLSAYAKHGTKMGVDVIPGGGYDYCTQMEKIFDRMENNKKNDNDIIIVPLLRPDDITYRIMLGAWGTTMDRMLRLVRKDKKRQKQQQQQRQKGKFKRNKIDDTNTKEKQLLECATRIEAHLQKLFDLAPSSSSSFYRNENNEYNNNHHHNQQQRNNRNENLKFFKEFGTSIVCNVVEAYGIVGAVRTNTTADDTVLDNDISRFREKGSIVGNLELPYRAEEFVRFVSSSSYSLSSKKMAGTRKIVEKSEEKGLSSEVMNNIDDDILALLVLAFVRYNHGDYNRSDVDDNACDVLTETGICNNINGNTYTDTGTKTVTNTDTHYSSNNNDIRNNIICTLERAERYFLRMKRPNPFLLNEILDAWSYHRLLKDTRDAAVLRANSLLTQTIDNYLDQIIIPEDGLLQSLPSPTPPPPVNMYSFVTVLRGYSKLCKDNPSSLSFDKLESYCSNMETIIRSMGKITTVRRAVKIESNNSNATISRSNRTTVLYNILLDGYSRQIKLAQTLEQKKSLIKKSEDLMIAMTLRKHEQQGNSDDQEKNSINKLDKGNENDNVDNEIRNDNRRWYFVVDGARTAVPDRFTYGSYFNVLANSHLRNEAGARAVSMLHRIAAMDCVKCKNVLDEAVVDTIRRIFQGGSEKVDGECSSLREAKQLLGVLRERGYIES